MEEKGAHHQHVAGVAGEGRRASFRDFWDLIRWDLAFAMRARDDGEGTIIFSGVIEMDS